MKSLLFKHSIGSQMEEREDVLVREDIKLGAEEDSLRVFIP